MAALFSDVSLLYNNCRHFAPIKLIINSIALAGSNDTRQAKGPFSAADELPWKQSRFQSLGYPYPAEQRNEDLWDTVPLDKGNESSGNEIAVKTT